MPRSSTRRAPTSLASGTSFNYRHRPGKECSPSRLAMQAVVEQLEPGEVISYGDVATRAGCPGAARTAGSVLANCPETVPWWRVVYGDGRLPPCNPSLQAERLAEEGVSLEGFRVVASLKGRFA